MKKILIILILFSGISVLNAQKPSDYFSTGTSKVYTYQFLDKNMAFQNKWQVIAFGNCEREQDRQCLNIEMYSQAGNYLGKTVPEKTVQYEIKVQISAEYANLMQWNRYEETSEGIKSEVWITEIPLLKIPDVGKTVLQTTSDGKYQIKITIAWVSVFTLKEKKYTNVLQTIWELSDAKTGKYVGKRCFFFAKKTGLLRFESFNENNELILNRSFELEKIN
jgi:hypothetical protein